ncbi:hypothetical protein SPBRAN_447 [uncultured Candidatus Thioglobus sp.]|nr:hypothetical protein SPBRAN_447 [uncultured Candidatus Thioglobus sp.]
MAVLSIYNPIFGIWTTITSAVIAVFSIGWGLWFGVIAIILNLIGFLSLSQEMWIEPGFAIYVVFLVLAQIAAMIVLVKRHRKFKTI